MGANMINTIAEYLAPKIEKIIEQPTALRILSNYATQRCSRSWCCIPVDLLQKENIRVLTSPKVSLKHIALPIVIRRAATHNKGVMNGIDAVVIATGNDWRAIEAGAHVGHPVPDSIVPSQNGFSHTKNIQVGKNFKIIRLCPM